MEEGVTKQYHELIKAEDSFLGYSNIIQRLPVPDRRIFIDAILDKFETGRIYEDVEYYVEKGLDPKIEEHHFLGEDRSSRSLKPFLRHLALAPRPRYVLYQRCGSWFFGTREDKKIR